MKRLLIILFLIPSLCYASDLTLQGSWNHTSNSNYSDGLGANLRFEEDVLPGVALGAELGLHGKMAHDPYGELSGTSLLAEIICYPPVTWDIKPYILGGLGYSWWSFDRSQEMKDAQIDISVGDSLAQKIAVGAYYQINEKWSLNVEWAYFHAAIPKDAIDNTNGQPANVLGNDDRSGRVRIGEEELSLMFGVRYSF